MAVKGLLHYALEVPDPSVGESFYRDFGLQAAGSRGNSIRLKTSCGAGELHLFEGPKKRLHHIAFAAPGENFDAVRAALKRAGVPEIDAPKNVPEIGIWLRDPDGNLVNIRQEERKTIPPEPAAKYNGPGNVNRVGLRGMPTFDRPNPRRLGHALFFTPDPDAATRFYTETSGFQSLGPGARPAVVHALLDRSPQHRVCEIKPSRFPPRLL